METFKYLTSLVKSQLNIGTSPSASRDELPPPKEIPSEDYPVVRHHASFFPFPSFGAIMMEFDENMRQFDANMRQFDANMNQHDVAMNQHDVAMNQHDVAMNQHDVDMNQQDNYSSIGEIGYEPKYSNPRDQMLKQPDSEYQEPGTSRDIETWTRPVQRPFSLLDLFFGFNAPENFENDSPRSSYIKDQYDDIVPAYNMSSSSNEGEVSEQFGGNVHYTYTSINRVQRADGKIEERKTFKDSTGKDEVTVTEIDPSVAGSLVSDHDLPALPKFPSFPKFPW